MMERKAVVVAIVIAVLMLLFIIPREALSRARYSQVLCQSEGYTCLKVQKGQSWENLFPDENQRTIVMRLNRINERLFRGQVIAVPEKLDNIDYMQLSPLEQNIGPTGQKQIIIDPVSMAFGAYDENGNLLRWGPASLGQDWCSDIDQGCRTKTGVFKVYEKRGEGCFSSKFPVPDGGAPMPYCMFFHGGIAIHASHLPGYNASHGCVRVFYEDALWLNREFASVGTAVTVRPYET